MSGMGSQEVGRRRSGRNDPLRVRHCSEELGLSCVGVLEHHDGGDVAAAIAVVGRRPNCDQLLVEHELVALVHQLVGAADQLQVVDVNKLQGDGDTRGEDGTRMHSLDPSSPSLFLLFICYSIQPL